MTPLSRFLSIPLAVALIVAPGVAAAAAPLPQAADDVDARIADAVGQLDAITADMLARSGVPGAAVAVVHGDDLLYAKGFGVRDVDTGAPVSAETVFQLASVSKSVGASVVAAAVGKGIARWKDPVVSHLPWFTLADPYVTRNATIADMYAMTSGLPHQAGDVLEGIGYDRQQILKRLKYLPLIPFRTEHLYTNFGLTAGAEAVAEAAGKDWASLSDDLIYGPLGMASTSSRHSDFVKESDRASLHVPIDGSFVSKYTRMPDAQSPAGGVSSNVLDMSRWLQMEMDHGRYGGRQVVASRSLAKAQTAQIRTTPVVDAAFVPRWYGSGMAVTVDQSGQTRLTHSGAFSAGAGTTYLMLPKERLGIVVLSNAFVGLPEAIAAAFADIVETGAVTRDWLPVVSAAFAPTYAPNTDLARASRPADARAPRPFPDYVGTYTNGYFGDVTARTSRGRLQLVMGPDRVVVPLRPWTGDTFVGRIEPGDWPTDFLVTFSAGSGQVNRLHLDLGDGEAADTLTRITAG